MEAAVVVVRIFNIMIGTLGILGNGLVCLVIAKVSSMQTRTNAFIFHQAVVDFLGSTVILLKSEIPVPGVPLPDNALGWFLCFMWTYNSVVAFTIFATSTLNLLAVTLERYFAIVHPFKYQAAFSKYPRLKVGAVFAICWTISIILYLFSFRIFEMKDGECLSIPGSTAYGMVVVFVTYVAPVSVMLFAYIRTGVELKRGAARVGPSSGQATGMAESLLKARRNTFKTLLIVFITFLVCWTPNELIFLMFNLGVFKLTYQEWYFLTSVALVATNCCVNPVIYLLKYRQFRNGLREIFCGNRHRSVDVSSVETVSTQASQSHP